MKIAVLVTLVALLAVSSCNSSHLRTSDSNHQFLDFSNPLNLASILSGDYVSLLPSFIQPLARKILGQEQQSGVSGFLNQAKNFLGGNNNPSGGLFGGLGNLFGQAASQGNNDISGVLNNFSGAFGGKSNANNGNPLGGLSNILGNFGINLHEWFVWPRWC